MMKKTIIVITAILAYVSVFAQTDVFPVEYQNIKKMKPTEAEIAYVKLAESSTKAEQKDAACFAAIEKAISIRNFENAERYASFIKDENLRNLGTMKILQKQEKWNDLIAFSKDFKLEMWRDPLIPEAALMRGNAYALLKNFENGEKDLKLAIDAIAPAREKYEMIYNVSTIYASYIKNPAKELEIIKQGFSIEKSSPHLYRQRVNCRYAVLLAETGKLDEGIQFLEVYAVECDAAATRQFSIKVTLGDLYLKKGDKAKAITLYKEAETLPKLSAGWSKIASDKIANISK